MTRPLRLPSPPASDVYGAYQDLLADPCDATMGRFAREVTPQIVAAARRLYPSIDGLDRDGVVNDALAHVLTVATAGRLLDETPEQLQAYLGRTIINAVHSACRGTLYQDTAAVDDVQVQGADVVTAASAGEILAGLPDRVARYCVEHNRFPELSEALVRYVVRCMLTGEPVSRTLVEKYGGLDSPGWYVGYVDVLVRCALYETKDALSGCAAPR